MRNSPNDNIQHGDEIDVLFAFNPGTEMFYEEMNFPYIENDWRRLWLQVYDYIDTAKFYGMEDCYDSDITCTIMLANGKLIDLENLDPKKAFQTIKDFSVKNRPLFIIYSDDTATQFNFTGWKGLLALQEYTGWFDMTLYEDTWL